MIRSIWTVVFHDDCTASAFSIPTSRRSPDGCRLFPRSRQLIFVSLGESPSNPIAEAGALGNAPRGKVPFITVDGVKVADL